MPVAGELKTKKAETNMHPRGAKMAELSKSSSLAGLQGKVTHLPKERKQYQSKE